MSRKNKFDLANLVHSGYLQDKETVYFVSDSSKTAVVMKQPNGDYKLACDKELVTVHAFAQRCLGQEPPEHASRWLRNQAGKTLYELWQAGEMEEAA